MRTKTPLQADKMLEAAGRLFGQRRFHEVRMEDIAAEAQVGKGTLYRYFRDKEELYLALLTRASEQYMCRLRTVMAQADGPRAQLEAMVTAIIDFFDEHPNLLSLIQRAEVLHDDGAAFPWQKTRDEVFQLVMDLFESASNEGDFTVQDPETAALLLFGGLRSILRFGSQPRPPDLCHRLVEQFLYGNAVPERLTHRTQGRN